MSEEVSTRPTWETVLERMGEMEGRLNERLTSLGEELRAEVREQAGQLRNEMKAALRKVEDKIDVLNQNILDVRADHRDLKRRVEDMEKNAA